MSTEHGLRSIGWPVAGLLLLLLLGMSCRPVSSGDPVVRSPAALLIPPPTPLQPTPTRFDDPTATARPPTATAGVMPASTTPPAAGPTPAPAVPVTETPTPAPTPCTTPGRIETGTYTTALAGPLAYRVYLPPCYGLDGHVYPALYLLGGNVHDDSLWDRLGADETAEAGIGAGALQPLVIVMPDGNWIANQTSGGPGSFESTVMNELIPTLEQAYCLWPDRAGRAIGGLSRGGYWSLEIAFRNAGLFRSVGAHSPALIDSFAGPDLDPVYTGVANDLSGLRIWVDLGERDPYLISARPLHDALTGASVDHVWQISPGQHEEAYWIENLPAYLTWYNDGWALDRSELPLCP